MDSTIQGFYGTSWEVRDLNVPEYFQSMDGSKIPKMFKADYFTINGSISLGNANYFAKYELREVNVPRMSLQ